MAGPFDDLIGELQPGQKGWLPLDSSGSPTGPATISPPPGPDAKACSVMAVIPSDPVDPEEHLLVSSSGAPLDPPLNSNIDRRVGGVDTPEPPPPISLTALLPNTAECHSADFELSVKGNNFTNQSVIVFNGYEEPTDFIDAQTIGTGVKPSLFVVPASVPCFVRDGEQETDPINFEFTAPARRSREEDTRRRR